MKRFWYTINGVLRSAQPAMNDRDRLPIETAPAWTETIGHEAVLDEEGEIVTQAWTETIEHAAQYRLETNDELLSRVTLRLLPEGASAPVILDVGVSPEEALTHFPGALLAPPSPISVSPWQARKALLDAGLLASVEAAVEAAGTASEAYIAWHYAERIRRDSPLIAALAPALGLSDAQLDGLFQTAKGLSL